MGISTFGASGSVEMAFRTPWSARTAPFTQTTAGTWYTAVSISGAGYLSRAIVKDNQGGSNVQSIRITIDGVLKLVAKTTSGDTLAAVGCFVEDFLAGSSAQHVRGAGGSVQVHGTQVPWGDISGLTGICSLAAPIIFNTSLLIELSSTTNSSTCNFDAIGGKI